MAQQLNHLATITIGRWLTARQLRTHRHHLKARSFQPITAKERAPQWYPFTNPKCCTVRNRRTMLMAHSSILNGSVMPKSSSVRASGLGFKTTSVLIASPCSTAAKKVKYNAVCVHSVNVRLVLCMAHSTRKRKHAKLRSVSLCNSCHIGRDRSLQLQETLSRKVRPSSLSQTKKTQKQTKREPQLQLQQRHIPLTSPNHPLFLPHPP